MSAVLIAGCGDVGTRAGLALVERGWTVHGLRRRANELPRGIAPISADLDDADTLRDLPRVDVLVFAATPDVRTTDAYRRTFVDAPLRVLDALPSRPSRVVFVSSSAVYGEHGGEWIDESTPTAPLAFNGDILVEAERAVAARASACVVLRLAGIYGPGRTRTIEEVRAGGARCAPNAYANRIHAVDAGAAVAHLVALAKPQALYIGVDDAPSSQCEVYTWIAERLGVAGPTIANDAAPSGVGNKRLSNARLRASGWSPRYPDYRSGYTALLPRSERGARTE